ncbi:unnamed protein product [Rotaria sp. Silwood2]|nr:unnamed protein product [Rotaria sp. Silwood2]CAF2765243.1 unnamed protein product [Rotaria sp. Silwood2]CAF3182077.1 unnamed protein product [Rotaria sp. Silwood2]CAF4189436.1 unnamed protein product [Rotaria sp. Silwood2]CAF4195641.1 unnamed protein product [Rotaria sp. Silwood2]
MGEKATTNEVIAGLLNALRDIDWYGVRPKAREALGKMGEKAATNEVITSLLNALPDENSDVRRTACEALGQIGEKAATNEVIAGLLNALQEENFDVRRKTSEALGKIGEKAATNEMIAGLLDALRDEDSGVRHIACEALGKMGEKAAMNEVITGLLTALRDEDSLVRQRVQQALEIVGEKASTSKMIAGLRNALYDEDRRVRCIACEVLGKIGEKAATNEVIAGLCNTLYDEDCEIETLFNYDLSSEDRRKPVSEACDAIQHALLNHFVPRFLGLGHLNRSTLLSHYTSYSRIFFGEGTCLIWDGTYLYINKSRDHLLQKQTYFGRKKRHLVQMMSITFPDRYVSDTIGPYARTENDATIAQHITQVNEQLQQWCEPEDVAIVDRGFDRVQEVLEDMGLVVRMPSFFKGKQHSTEEANQARLVAKVRCGIKVYHARLKKFTFLQHTIQNSLFGKNGPYVKTVTASLNCFRSPIFKSSDPKKEEKLARIIIARVKANNQLQTSVQKEH